ncbi:kelch-like protein 10 isoform X2 [Zootermopsis nevadensis]|uniref:kelch-like protein 10 isoform X2 n=1 Tax=Zootermopsis nevadensis TaxID=136037 RepID=UPI000B8E843A|nr:kelch-like protein 10 isoform X2 [Zootermopsis nevadensis]
MITKEDKDFLIPKIARPRIPQDILFAIGGYRGESPTALIETYDTRADRWSVMEEVYQKDERFSHGTALVGFNIYVIGGSNGNRALSSCRYFNVVTKTWHQVAPMHECRSEVTVAVLGEILYAMGGCGLLLLEEQRTAEKYDFKTNQWSLIAPMNMDRCDADKIYVAGGCGNYLILSTVEVYDPVTDQWTFVAPLHSERSSLRCIVFHGILYALGGFNEVSRSLSAEKFDPAEDTWTEIHDMCVARQNFSAHVIDDTIFIIDGYHGDETIFSVECFNSKKNEWYHATEMNVRRTGMSICVVKNLPNAKDYAHKHRDEIMEKIRKKLLAWETQRQQAFDYNLDEHTKFNHIPQENNEENWALM